MNLLLYPHGGSGNHGCEAIVRSTIKILSDNIILYSSKPEEDLKYGLDELCIIKKDQNHLSRKSVLYWKAVYQYYLLKDKKAFDRALFNPIFQGAGNVDFALSIGGDNYCYDVPEFIYLINQQLLTKKVRTILWGCSVNPDSIHGKMLKDLQSYAWIFARESITYRGMKSKGIKNVSLFPDPAFQLNRIDYPLPEGFIEGNTIGINISPMIISYEDQTGITLTNYIKLIEYIIKTTDMQIALIPHVVWQHNDDRRPLRYLYDKFYKTGRVILIDDAPAEILKGYIARCRFMIAARTHASIAAYSESVPTLVIGYSVKARGIAMDIFGTEENYVVPVQALQDSDDLIHAFQWLQEYEDAIRILYNKRMPRYINKSLEIKDELRCL